MIERLAAEGVEAGLYVPCVHLQPYMRERYGFARGAVPGGRGRGAPDARAPVLHRIEPEDQERVVEALRDAISA